MRLLKELDGIVACIALSVTIIVTIVNIIVRYAFKFSLPWSQEVAVTCFSWMVMLGMSYAYKYNMHYGVDFIIVKTPDKVRRLVYILIYSILMIGSSILTYYSILISIKGWFKVTAYLQMPYTYKYISAAIGFMLMSVYSLTYLYLALFKKETFNDIVTQGGSGLATFLKSKIKGGKIK